MVTASFVSLSGPVRPSGLDPALAATLRRYADRIGHATLLLVQALGFASTIYVILAGPLLLP